MLTNPTGRFFYSKDFGTALAPCDFDLALARDVLRSTLEDVVPNADHLTRAIDQLILAHVEHYARRNPGHHHQ